MKNELKKWLTVTLLVIGFLLLAGCNDNSTEEEVDMQLVEVSVERTGGLISGIGKVKVYIDGEQVMKVKNKTSESVELLLLPGTHTIQTKGQGDKSKKVEFEVLEGQENYFSYQTEISNIYGLSLERTN